MSMSNKTNFTVVRNAGYQVNSIEVRERHNERKNETYYNADIIQERANLNIYFKQNFSPDGTPETYAQTFNRMLDNGTIVKRGLKPDAKVIDEFVFDVNTAYFDEGGGYEYAKSFFEEAYRMAVKEAGGEQYIISAIMHADEKNTALSEQLGRDVYHYHLHVIYVPVVEKEILWTKRCKDPALVGTVKEVIPQISHSKKWAKYKDETGKWINEYSLLQDRYFNHMRAAGFDDFERGELGSTKEHLTMLKFKVQQEKKRLAEAEKQNEKAAAETEKLVQATKVRADILATQTQIANMAKPGKSGNNVIVTNPDWKRVSEMAKRCVLLDEKIKDTQKQIDNLKRDRDMWKTNYNNLWNEVKDFIKAIRSIPQKLLAFISEHLPKSHNREI
jgi:cell division protein FtsB